MIGLAIRTLLRGVLGPELGTRAYHWFLFGLAAFMVSVLIVAAIASAGH